MPRDELKPCPFCSGADLSVGRWGDERVTVACNTCDIDGPTGVDRGDAVNAWNARANPSVGVEALLAALEQIDAMPLYPEPVDDAENSGLRSRYNKAVGFARAALSRARQE